MHTDAKSESESEFVLPFLTHTVTFKCVCDALDYVHAAISAKKIISVKFAWVHCGPGFFAGINIALNGEWPR